MEILLGSYGFFSAGTHGATGLHNEPLNSGVSPPATKTPFIPFIDKVMGNKSCLQPPPLRDLFNEKLVHIEYEGGNTIKPMVQIDNSVFEGRLCAPWENALFIKLLSKRVGYQTMIDRLRVIAIMQNGGQLYSISVSYLYDYEKQTLGWLKKKQLLRWSCNDK
ncbi:hypothetical protein HKD37_01G000871 [Glycine soja]